MKALPYIFPVLLCCACDTQVTGESFETSGQTPVSAVQGSGGTSPLDGRAVTVSGIVTGDFQDNDADVASSLGGFYLQSEMPDDNPDTSEGLFVFDRNAAGPDVSVGARVTVIGVVDERYGETQLNATEVRVTGAGTAVPQPLRLPANGTMRNADGTVIADLERFEGMFVRVEEPMYVQDLSGLERYGEILLSTEPRQHQFTSTSRPDRAAYREHRERVARQMLMLDDGRVEQNISPIRYVGSANLPGRAPRLSDAVESIQGVLRYSRGSGPNGLETWRLMPTSEPRFRVRNPRPEKPDVEGQLVVASFNLLNYFSTVDNGDRRCGPDSNEGCRGADSMRELERQRQRTAYAINHSGAAIVGVMELENNSRESNEDLLSALTSTGDEWRYINTGTVGDDVIRVGFFYRPDFASPIGDYAVLDSTVDSRFNDRRNRPAVAQTFRAAGGGELTVVVNHLKSKGSPCDEDGDPNRNDGQGNCSGVRTAAAEALASWLATDPTDSGDSDVLIIGDLNAYMNEDPVIALENAGYTNLLRQYVGEKAWSIVFRGESGTLDHALASASLAEQVVAAGEWHINSDEAPIYDYNLDFGRDPELFEPSAPWRASDHDPLLISLSLTPD